MQGPAVSVAEPGATDGFVTLRAGSCFVKTELRFESAVRELGLLEPGGLAGLVARGGGPSGRTGNVILELDALDVRLHVRPLRHGGWLATLPGKRLFRIARPLEELRVHRALHDRGAPVPAPAFVVAERGRGPWWIAAFATVHEERAPDAAAFLAARPERERVEAAAAAAGRALRRFHDLGARHRDLHVKNLLVRQSPESVEIVIIDLDRARLAGAPSPAERMAEIMRLHRSLVKRKLIQTSRSWAGEIFLEAYCAGDDVLRRALESRIPRERRRLALHRLGYRRGAARRRASTWSSKAPPSSM